MECRLTAVVGVRRALVAHLGRDDQPIALHTAQIFEREAEPDLTLGIFTLRVGGGWGAGGEVGGCEGKDGGGERGRTRGECRA